MIFFASQKKFNIASFENEIKCHLEGMNIEIHLVFMFPRFFRTFDSITSTNLSVCLKCLLGDGYNSTWHQTNFQLED
jgi:hypothetical protein